MTQFKVGDRVVRTSISPHGQVVEGAEYTVVEVKDGGYGNSAGLVLEGLDRTYTYTADYFDYAPDRSNVEFLQRRVKQLEDQLMKIAEISSSSI